MTNDLRTSHVSPICATALPDRPLDERRGLLRAKVMLRMPEQISLSETLDATAADIVAAVKKQGLEGVIAKRRDSRYEPGRRSGTWVRGVRDVLDCRA